MSDRKKHADIAWEKFKRHSEQQLRDYSPSWEEIQKLRRAGLELSNRGAYDQFSRASSHGTPETVAAMALYQTFLPADGQESALARLMVAATNAAMDCLARAATAESSPVRVMELGLASKLSQTVESLSKTLDSHRGPDRPPFIYTGTKQDGSAYNCPQEGASSKPKPKT